MPELKDPASPTVRLHSVDFLRGATVLAMLFVNDLAGVRGTPWWARHMPSTTDGMTFVDLVFPCFLFVVGLSIPLALGRRMDAGESMGATLRTILLRTASLVFVGVLMVNMGQHNGYVLPKPWWTLLAYLSVMAIWNSPGTGASPRSRILAQYGRYLGVAVLVFLMAIFRANQPGQDLVWFRSQWWGILGLIGWAYLTVALWWRLFPRDHAAMAGLVGLLTCLGLAKRGADTFFTGTPVISTINSWVELGGQIGGHGSIVAAGALLGMALRDGMVRGAFVRMALLWGGGLILAGFCLRPYTNGFSKDFATPSWCLLCAGLSAVLMALCHALLSGGGQSGRSLLKPDGLVTGSVIRVGQWALVPYLLAPIAYALFKITGLETFYSAATVADWPSGLARSVVFTVLMALASLGLIRGGLRLRL